MGPVGTQVDWGIVIEIVAIVATGMATGFGIYGALREKMGELKASNEQAIAAAAAAQKDADKAHDRIDKQQQGVIDKLVELVHALSNKK